LDTKLKTNNDMQALNNLKQYANLQEDWYFKLQLDLLEVEIKELENKAKLSVYKSINK
jgi:hypothetical protein